jgi:hypothetical protein
VNTSVGFGARSVGLDSIWGESEVDGKVVGFRWTVDGIMKCHKA